MNFARRLFSSSSRAASSVQGIVPVAEASSIPTAYHPATSKSQYIEMDMLPKAVRKAVERSLPTARAAAKDAAAAAGKPWDGKVVVQNPFLHSWRPSTDPNMRGKFLWTEAAINVRRQKKLLDLFPASMLPPSTANPIRKPSPVRWEDGTIITWKGVWKRKSGTSLYASRRLQANGTYFKGTKAEREAPARKAEREERMAGMAKRIEEFRKNSKNTKVQGRNAVPF